MLCTPLRIALLVRTRTGARPGIATARGAPEWCCSREPQTWVAACEETLTLSITVTWIQHHVKMSESCDYWSVHFQEDNSLNFILNSNCWYIRSKNRSQCNLRFKFQTQIDSAQMIQYLFEISRCFFARLLEGTCPPWFVQFTNIITNKHTCGVTLWGGETEFNQLFF